MIGGPRRRRGRLWAGLYAAAFDPGDDASADESDGEGDDALAPGTGVEDVAECGDSRPDEPTSADESDRVQWSITRLRRDST